MNTSPHHSDDVAEPELSPIDLRTRASRAIAELRSYTWSMESIRQALGLNEDYFERIAAEAQNLDRKAGRTQLNLRIVTALESMAERISAPPSFDGGMREYIGAVCADIQSLGAGDHHTLLSCPPPLEAYSVDIVHAALKAARNDAQLDYYLPSAAYIRWATEHLLQLSSSRADSTTVSSVSPEIVSGLSPEDLALNKAIRMFGWVSDLKPTLDLMLNRFATEARMLDATEPSANGAFSSALGRIRFFELDVMPLNLNEKIVWLSRSVDHIPPRKVRIYREVLLPSARDGEPNDSSVARLTPYGETQRWCRVGYPTDYMPLAALLRQIRRPIILPSVPPALGAKHPLQNGQADRLPS